MRLILSQTWDQYKFDPKPLARIFFDASASQSQINDVYYRLAESFSDPIPRDITKELLNGYDSLSAYHVDRTWYWYESPDHTSFLLTTEEQVIFAQLAFDCEIL